ncbi:hypothetical protein [Lysinibacillus irui]|uniref:hypothetical protein n=1 Tax=Lysinibacillus irui TaxID=2998077 RepID=UPI002AD22C73|nr:hypothetical protein [Lysinibacillus irui]MEA0562277.1 hypothetical protein [Lysinibacillus irui]
MRRDQLSYFIYPIIYFIVRTFNQWRKDQSITWAENTVTLIGTMVIMCAFIWLWNWSKKPYQWGKNKKET